MPHTSHRKRKLKAQQEKQQERLLRNKRGEVMCKDGWTRIIRSDKASQLTAGALDQDTRQTAHTMANSHGDYALDQDSDEGETRAGVEADPAEIPDGTSLETALSHYRRCEAALKLSNTWIQLKKCMEDHVSQGEGLRQLANCICFGLGSPTGLARPAVDLRNIAMYQLAVFKSMADLLSDHRRQQHQRQQDSKSSNTDDNVGSKDKTAITPLECLAQEPRFNDLDTALLSTLNIKVVLHPQAFHSIISGRTFAFCPGAEQHVTRGTLSRYPAMYVGSTALETYTDQRTGCIRSPNIGGTPLTLDMFGGLDTPFPYFKVNCYDPTYSKNNNSNRDQQADVVEADPDDRVDSFIAAHATRGAEILHRFKVGKRSFRFPDFDPHSYALHDLRFFWTCDGEEDVCRDGPNLVLTKASGAPE